MSNQDHVFVKIEIVNRKPDALTVIRTNRQGMPVETFSECVDFQTDFAALVLRMQDKILAPSKYSKEYVVVAHYSEIEREILKKNYKSITEVFAGRTWISCSQLIWPMVEAQMVPSTSFDTACSYFGIDRNKGMENKADSERDCVALARIFFELIKRYKSALVVEEGVRDFGGPWLEKARAMFGV